MARRRPKKISPQQISGQQGVNMVEHAVLAMGFAWHPTNQALEAGIDGIIEIIDPETHQATNSIIQVQVKTTSRRWTYETTTEFTYRCEPADIDYWMRGNTPVILVAVRFDGSEAYWADVKASFAEQSRRDDRHLHFDKATDRFDESAARDLVRLAVPKDSGAYLPAPNHRETLVSNLLQIRAIPPNLFVASTEYRDPKDVIEWSKREEVRLPKGWYLADGMIYSFHNLREEPWGEICDRGSVEQFESDEWSESDEDDRRRRFVRLLNQAFRQDMRLRGLWWSKEERCYFFPARRLNDEEVGSRTYWYRSLKQQTSSEVVKVQARRDGDGILYFRHDAFRAAFLRVRGEWCLAITPHYIFTSDGRMTHPYGEDWLSGLKRQEKQKAILSQVAMWKYKLTEKRSKSLFDRSEHESLLIEFGELLTTESTHGFSDQDWLKGDPMSATDSDAGPESDDDGAWELFE